MKNNKKKSQREYKVSTTSIGELVAAQARSGTPKARKAAKRFLKVTGGKY